MCEKNHDEDESELLPEFRPMCAAIFRYMRDSRAMDLTISVKERCGVCSVEFDSDAGEFAGCYPFEADVDYFEEES